MKLLFALFIAGMASAQAIRQNGTGPMTGIALTPDSVTTTGAISAGTTLSVGTDLTVGGCIKTGTTGNPLSVNCDTSKNVQISSTIVANFLENYGAADGTAYYTFLSSMAASLPSGAEISNLLGRIRWYKGDNSNAILNGIEGVCSSDVADESITCRGASLRTYTAPGGTLRTSVGADVSARASYSGGTEITAESGTAFVGERIWMAPYFSDASIANVNNFHGLWIYNEATAKTVTNGIKLSGAGGTAFTNDINLQNGETISNATDGTITQTGNSTVTGNLTVQGASGISTTYGSSASSYTIPGASSLTSTTTILKGPVGIGTASPSTVDSLDTASGITDRGQLTVVSSATVKGVIGASQGSATAPSIAFSGDPDTGLYNIGTNSLGVAVGGGLRWRFDDAGLTYQAPGTLYTSTFSAIAAPVFAVGYIVTGSSAPAHVPSIASTSYIGIATMTVTGMRGGRTAFLTWSVNTFNAAGASRDYTFVLTRNGVTFDDEHIQTNAGTSNDLAGYSLHDTNTVAGTVTYCINVKSSSATGAQTAKDIHLTLQEF